AAAAAPLALARPAVHVVVRGTAPVPRRPRHAGADAALERRTGAHVAGAHQRGVRAARALGLLRVRARGPPARQAGSDDAVLTPARARSARARATPRTALRTAWVRRPAAAGRRRRALAATCGRGRWPSPRGAPLAKTLAP